MHYTYKAPNTIKETNIEQWSNSPCPHGYDVVDSSTLQHPEKDETYDTHRWNLSKQKRTRPEVASSSGNKQIFKVKMINLQK